MGRGLARVSALKKMMRFFPIILFAACFCCAGYAGSSAFAHPEDEFCSEESGMDPALCRELAKLDSETAEEESPATEFGDTELEPISLDRPIMETVGLYAKLGFVHILPRGYDHILFVFALFLASIRLRPLLIQISSFTVAHTISLGLAAAGLISVPGNIVEPLIALSIAVVAVENIFFRDLTKWRPVIIFGFGLFHGLGFASVLSGLGLIRDQFLVSLVSFNVGVEFGQLAIIALAFIAATTVRRFMPISEREQIYRRFVVWPASAVIAFFGLIWFVTRLGG